MGEKRDVAAPGFPLRRGQTASHSRVALSHPRRTRDALRARVARVITFSYIQLAWDSSDANLGLAARKVSRLCARTGAATRARVRASHPGRRFWSWREAVFNYAPSARLSPRRREKK